MSSSTPPKKMQPFELTLKEFSERDINRLFAYVQQQLNLHLRLTSNPLSVKEKKALLNQANEIFAEYVNDPVRAQEKIDVLIAKRVTPSVEYTPPEPFTIDDVKTLLEQIKLIGDKNLFDKKIIEFMLLAIVRGIEQGKTAQECFHTIINTYPSTVPMTILHEEKAPLSRIEFRKGIEHATLFDAIYSFVRQKIAGITLLGPNSVYHEIDIPQLAKSIANDMDLKSEPSVNKAGLPAIVAHIIDSYASMESPAACKLALQHILVAFIRSQERVNVEIESLLGLMNIQPAEFTKLRKQFADTSRPDDELLAILINREKNEFSQLRSQSVFRPPTGKISEAKTVGKDAKTPRTPSPNSNSDKNNV